MDRVLTECGRLEHRCRRLMVYALLLMCLYPGLGYQRLMHHLAEAAPAPGRWFIPNKSSFARARARLGAEVIERLFRALAGPLADERAEGCRWRGRRVMAIDGSTGELADNPELQAAFGGPTPTKGRRPGPPQARVVGLVECGTRALADIAIGRFRDGESRLAAVLVRSITPGMLLLADRNFPSVRLWRLFTKAGADLLWRAKEPVANRVVRRLPDGQLPGQVRRRQAGAHRARDRVHAARLDHHLPLAHQPARSRHGARIRAGRALRRALGDRGLLRRAQGRPVGAASSPLPHPRRRTPGVLGSLRPLPGQPPARLPGRHADPDRDCDRISFSAVQDAFRRGARLATGLTVRRVTAALRAAIGELTTARALLKRRDRVCPRVTRHKQPKHPSRARYTGPAATTQPRRPEIILCA